MKEKIQYRYKSASLALAELKELGYTIDYNIEKDQIKQDSTNFDITYIYRYEGDSNPDDESSVYGIVNNINGDKGVYVVGNLGTDDEVDHFLIQLEIKRRTIE
ncbi:hypothetical protein [Empedobacter sedimenti]|uniref:hypothetical protein n=1 Tax=Empedobacter sedimenti TaxID=3042610 RepID=UPI0024A6F3E9|nr:hypothetical protein [Empedobacter sedimenti]